MRKVIYAIRKEHNIVLKLWSGDIGNMELAEFERAPFLDPKFPSTPPNGLCDITTANFSELKQTDLAAIAAIFKEYRKNTEGTRVAIVAAGQFEKARQFEAVMAGVGINVIAFTDLGTACTWLGVPFKETAQWFAEARAELARESAKA
jgi:hypothetical protein